MPVTAEVVAIEPLTQDILRVMLKPAHYVPYQAGQYLQVLLADDAVSYSIANAPLGARQYELHVRHRVENVMSQQVVREMREQGEVTIFAPLGHCHVGCLDWAQPILWIAQGTGFAPIKAMIEQGLADGVLPPSVLCWILTTASDGYLETWISQWEQHVADFHFVEALMETETNELVSQLLQAFPGQQQHLQVVLAGSFDRMRALRTALIHQGVRAERIFSDAFEESTA